MAALRLFTRFELSPIILRPVTNNESLRGALPIVAQVYKRWSSYKSSPVYDEKNPSKYTSYEITKDPEEWKYVENLLKLKIIPEISLEKKEYPSGWKPPIAKPNDYPYYIQRTKNYMQPVYLRLFYRGMRRITAIRRIQGDIWALESELTKYIEEREQKPMGVRVNELVGEIRYRGDYVNLIKKWLDEKGF
ncbi:Probable 39S ribosomal protein L49, mitochondrial [Anthophora retusa]